MRMLKILPKMIGPCAILLASLSAAPIAAQTTPGEAVKNVLLVHGAWADGSSWSKVVPLLEAKGLHVVAVRIPLTSFAGDVAAMKGEIMAPAWKSKPSWCVIAVSDRTISPTLEAAQAKKIGAATTTVASSHVVMSAHPSEAANVILDAVSKASSN
jgi:hypothetical protein